VVSMHRHLGSDEAEEKERYNSYKGGNVISAGLHNSLNSNEELRRHQMRGCYAPGPSGRLVFLLLDHLLSVKRHNR
jgi:hypothetical protein